MIALKIKIARIIFNLPPAFDPFISLRLNSQYLVQVRICDYLMSVHRLSDNLINIQKADLFLQKFLNCQLICRIKYSRMLPPALAASIAIGSPRKVSISGSSKVISFNLWKSRRSPSKYLRSG